MSVQKPSRYTGGEWNSVTKEWDDKRLKLALAYPDTYEIGMSNLGLGILYDRVNGREEFLAERVFAPWVDMEEALREADVPLFSLETRHPLNAFDVIGFSLQYELTYTNILNMLDLGRVPLFAKERTCKEPLVIAGGSGTYNPAPVAEFFDLFVIGEGEEVLLELLKAMGDWQNSTRVDKSRRALLKHLTSIQGIYVPAFYETSYNPDGTVSSITPKEQGIPPRVCKRIVPELGPIPKEPIVPSMRVIHDRAAIEIQRGCGHGCRFCQAGMIYRPVRWRTGDEILQAIDETVANTGYNEVGLASLSSSDHPDIAQIICEAQRRHRDKTLTISLPSLRMDSFSVELAKMVQETRRTGLTFAPEAGTQRLRDVINKGITKEDIFQTTEAAFENGWDRIKLYFMIGLPTETDEDVQGIVDIVQRIRSQGKRIRNRRVHVNLSIATFVPKAHTPFQWVSLASRQVIERRQQILMDNLRFRGVHLSWSDWDETWLEAILSTGDERLGAVVHRAWRSGARFDAWNEHFQPERWREAFAQEGLDPDFYVSRPRARDEILPWDIIDVGVRRQFLWHEYQRALKEKTTPGCSQSCQHCGILRAFATERQGLSPEAMWQCP
ncbi:MAG: TIGR03960 family B12-binding radical SAM protein [Chloroflexota bacterium]|nr:TIGR03960 family B12-binding radical SAM protein [Chloroflexota bacterium]